MSRFAMAAFAAASCCYWRLSAVALPGVRRWCATDHRYGAQRQGARWSTAPPRQKKTPRMCAAFRCVLRPVLLRYRPLEHTVDLLVRGIAAGLAGMRCCQSLIGSALRTAGRLAGRLCGAVGRVG